MITKSTRGNLVSFVLFVPFVNVVLKSVPVCQVVLLTSAHTASISSSVASWSDWPRD